MINKKNLLNHEFIGLKIKVINKKINGIIIDETKNTFQIRTNKGDKIIPKKNNEFKIHDNKINGNKIIQRPQNRLKKKYKVKNKWEEKLE